MSTTRTDFIALLVATLVVLGTLGSPLVGTSAAVQDQVAIYDSVGGSQVSTVTDGETVYIRADDSGTTNGTTVDVTVDNDNGGSITVTLYDDGTAPDQTGGDGEYWGSFTVSATTTDDTNDTLQVSKGNAANVTVDLDGQGDGDSASVTADYGPVPTGATTHDNTTDGTVDNVSVSFDEPVNDSVSYATGDFTVSNANVAAIADNDGDDTLRLELDSVTPNDTSLTPDVTVAQDALQDANGNAGPATGDVTVTADDGAAPVALNASYRDANTDGTVDRVDVVYSEDVSGSSYSDGDWSITSSGTVDIAKDGDGTVSGSEVRLNVTGAANTTGGSTAPTLDYSGSSVTDGPNDAPAQTLTMQDGAAPTFAGLTTVDADSNGTVDTLNVTFTESVASGSVEAADFSIDSANGLSGTVSGVADDDGDAAVNLTLNEGSSADTGATPTLAYTQSGGSSAAVQDPAGNQMIDTTSDAATDSAAPVVLSSASLDRNGDGTVDSVGVQYSENVSTSSPEIGDYSLGGSDSGAIMFDSSLVSDDTVYLSTIAPQNDTGLDLALSYDASAGTQGSITDGSNPAASFSGETVLDKADPRMVSVTTNDTNRNGTVDALTVTFTEPVNDSSVDAGDFSSPAGSVDGVTTGTADDNRTTLSVSGLSAGTAVTPDVTLAGDSLLDLSGNDNPSQTLTATDTASPAVTAASTADTNGDGSVDRIDLTLSEAIDDDGRHER